MPYSIQLIRKNEQTSNEWSGGLTTQLAIYPADASYTERKFKWRISSALVELEESVFSPLPGIDRLIMVIDGEMILEHVGHHRVHLKPYEQDHFSGSWTTRSFGKVRDFNLMLAKGCSGELKAISIEKDGFHELISMDNSEGRRTAEALYCVNGQIHITVDNQEAISVEEGDLILVNREHSGTNFSIKIVNKAEAAAKVIRASVIF